MGYLASAETAEVVNIAIALARPLLVEGEPGCGKTRLAHAIADELALGEPLKISVKSTSTAKDLLYRVDALSRLQDAQSRGNARAKFIYPYVSLGPLGEAIHGRGGRRVILLDEIDKADIDFPNDVLDVLEAYEFQIDELPPSEERACSKANGFGRKVSIEDRPKPILVITSNREKRLPEPFLRRCLYLRLEFPKTPEELREIIGKNLGGPVDAVDEHLRQVAASAFHEIRARAQRADAQKLPGTSELIDWMKILHYRKKGPADIDTLFPPHWKLLFKTEADRLSYETVAKQDLTRQEAKAAQ